MKKIILIATIFTILGCKAQTPILPLDGGSTSFGSTNGAYYKDIDNFLNQYVGTWLFTNGTTSLKLVLQEKIMFHEVIGMDQYYVDYIVGEFLYIENGVEKLNTLNNLTVSHSNINDYGLVGHGQYPKDIFPKCNECLVGEKRLDMYVNEPIIKNINGLEASMIAREFTESGVTKLKIWVIKKGASYGITYDDQPTTITKHTIPYGEYILIKQ